MQLLPRNLRRAAVATLATIVVAISAFALQVAQRIGELTVTGADGTPGCTAGAHGPAEVPGAGVRARVGRTAGAGHRGTAAKNMCFRGPSGELVELMQVVSGEF